MGDTWPIPAKAAQSLVGEMPSAEDYEMTGTLIEVRKAGAGTALTAVIGVSGQLNLSYGLSSLNAQIHFVFNPVAGRSRQPPARGPPPSQATARPRRADAGATRESSMLGATFPAF